MRLFTLAYLAAGALTLHALEHSDTYRRLVQTPSEAVGVALGWPLVLIGILTQRLDNLHSAAGQTAEAAPKK